MQRRIMPLQVALATAVLAIALYYAFGTRGIPQEAGYAGISARFFPTLISLFLAIVGSLLLYQALTGGLRGFTAPGETQRDWRGAAYVGGGLLLHAALITKIGFVLSATILFALVARGFGSTKPVRDAVTGACLALPVFWMFTRALDVSLPALMKPWF
jgi:putative tricarboxylic transport membrane protein